MAAAGSTSLTRNELPLPRTYYCTKCRCCAVSEQGDLCVFCEDNKICPEQLRRQKQPAAARASAPVSKPEPTDEAARIRQECEEEIAELRSALINQGWKLARAKGVAARVVADHPHAKFEERVRMIMSGNWGGELAPAQKSKNKLVAAIENTFGVEDAGPAGPAVGQAVKREKEESVPTGKEFDLAQYQKLAGQGLKAGEIAERLGVHVSTIYGAKKKLTANGSAERPPSKTAAKAKPTRKVTAAPATNGHANGAAVATLTVTESALDNFWTKLPIEEKARIVQENLIGVLGQ